MHFVRFTVQAAGHFQAKKRGKLILILYVFILFQIIAVQVIRLLKGLLTFK